MDSYHHHHHHHHHQQQQQQQHMMRPLPPPPPPQPQQQQQQQPPPPGDPYHHHLRPPLPPPQSTWHSNQFQYHHHHSQPPPPQQQHQHPSLSPSPSSTTLSPSPTPPHHLQWAPPQPPPPPHPTFPPLPPPHLPQQPPQSYHHSNHQWGNYNPNWSHHQSWDYSAQNNAEDWAARAREWAAAKKVTMEEQPLQPQHVPVSGPEGQIWANNVQYPQPVDSQYPEFQQQPFSASGYQQFPEPAVPLNQQPTYDAQSYHPNGALHYNSSAGAPPTASLSVHQQEVPSSYSSVTGREDEVSQMEQFHQSPLPFSIPHPEPVHHHQVQRSPPAISRSVSIEHPLSFDNHAAHLPMPLTDSVASLSSINSWSSSVGAVGAYPPIPSYDPSASIPSVTGHVPPYGGLPGSSTQTTIPSASSYGVGPSTMIHPTMGFPGDVYGVSNVNERPKKAPVPNWMKEELIKKASVITRSSVEHPKGEGLLIEDEHLDGSFGKGDLGDSKSIDSSRSNEEEEDDEDEENAEAARTAAINQEIKRIVTEVLLKVTDELFDEIATKVLDEDDENEANHDVSLLPTSKAKVLLPGPTKQLEAEDASEISSSSAPGNVLGLANYVSDEDDNEIQGPSLPNSTEVASVQQSRIPNVLENVHEVHTNGISSPVHGSTGDRKSVESHTNKRSSSELNNKTNCATTEMIEKSYPSKDTHGARHVKTSNGSENLPPMENGSVLKDIHGLDIVIDSERHDENISSRSLRAHDLPLQEAGRSHEADQHSSRSKENQVEGQLDEKAANNHWKRHEKLVGKDKADDNNGVKERMKERDAKPKESDTRKVSSHSKVKDDREESEKLNRVSSKEDYKRRGDRSRDEEDRGRHKHKSDSRQHRRKRSSSIGSRGRNSNENGSSGDESDDSKRKLHSRKRHSSPSPVRSKKRQVSRSPHSKRSQRRHSPYSSLESSRGRRTRSRSRSRSPPRRRR